jgi:hypothetical protein
MENDTGWWLGGSDRSRFWQKVDRNGGLAHTLDPLSTATGECWRWTAGTAGARRYGSFRIGSRMIMAHRIAYLDGSEGARIPEGWVVDHLCRNVLCVRPSHLEPITQSENVRRGSHSLMNRSVCRNGHPLKPENILRVRRSDSRFINACKTCSKESKHRSYEKRKARLIEEASI